MTLKIENRKLKIHSHIRTSGISTSPQLSLFHDADIEGADELFVDALNE